jgi:hypothetical protein
MQSLKGDAFKAEVISAGDAAALYQGSAPGAIASLGLKPQAPWGSSPRLDAGLVHRLGDKFGHVDTLSSIFRPVSGLPNRGS